MNSVYEYAMNVTNALLHKYNVIYTQSSQTLSSLPYNSKPGPVIKRVGIQMIYI